MTMTHREAQIQMQRARSKSAGKPLQNNTRLYVRGEGPGVEFGVVLHGTEVVTIKPDGSYVLRAGGYHTITTSDRIRRYSPAKLFSVSGQFYLWLEPSERDPRPSRVERAIPKPYDAVDPGPEPTKGTEGCVAGQLVTTEHVDELVETYRCDMRDGDEFVELVRQGSSGDRYDTVKVKRSWNSHIYITEQRHWDEGWAKLPDNNSPHSNYFINDDGEKVTRVQCAHCTEFDVTHRQWHYAMEGEYRRFDGFRGYRMHTEMMERFGTREAWQEAYLTELRARRAYLKADREWEERNRVPFYDGITIDGEGYAHRLREKGPSPAKLRRHEASVVKMKKRIEKYLDGYVKALVKGMPMPGAGDCWYCSLRTADGKPMGDAAQTLSPDGSLTQQVNAEHLVSHIEERYYVPSLAVNALREAGYKDTGVYLWLNMKPESNVMGGGDTKQYDTVVRALRSYMRKRLVPDAPTA